MPAYPYLFERKKQAAPGDVVVKLPPEFQPKGEVVVARQEALDLAAYLQGLNRTYPAAPAGEAVRDEGYALSKGEQR
jgi:cytochrome c oxidase cbb3-type subunit 2